MTEDNITETDESQETSASGEDNALIRSLRAELKEKERALKAAPSRSEVEADIRAAVARESAIEQLLVAAGQPGGLRPLVEEKLGDAEPTAEAVAEALGAIGFQVTAKDDSESQEDAGLAQHLNEVTSLGNQVQSAAQNLPETDVDRLLAAAKTPGEIDEIMRNAGLA